MKYGDIDDLLINIDENIPAKESEKEPAKEPEKPAAPVPTPEKKEKNIIAAVPLREGNAYLEDVDSGISDLSESENSETPVIAEDKPVDSGEDAGEAKEITKFSEPSVTESGDDRIQPQDFIIRGTRSWNSREPYAIQIDRDKLNDDYQDLLKTFFYLKGQGDEHAAQGDMKRAMFKFIRSPELNVIEEYGEFINGRLLSLASELGKGLDLEEDKRDLFIYHLGVLTLYKIITTSFQDTKTGYCFKLMAGNTVVRYLPLEYIKNVALKWHNDNINRSDLPYDSIIDYNELKRVIYKYYITEYEKYNKKLDEVLSKSEQNLNKFEREQILKSKGDSWFGKNNVFIYNRFLDRTIFKSVK